LSRTKSATDVAALSFYFFLKTTICLPFGVARLFMLKSLNQPRNSNLLWHFIKVKNSWEFGMND